MCLAVVCVEGGFSQKSDCCESLYIKTKPVVVPIEISFMAVICIMMSLRSSLNP